MSDMLFLSRLQPGHNGHLSAMQQAIWHWAKKIIFAIWSANKERTNDNPFTWAERHKIAECMVNILQQEHPHVEFEIHTVPDFGDGHAWKNYIDTTLPHFDAIVSGNTTVSKMRPEKRVIAPEMHVPYRASHIRYQLQIEDWKTIEQSVHADLVQLLHEIKAHETLQSIERLQPQPPKIATDLIIMHDGKYILWKRVRAPYGLALLGGFLDAWERIKDCALREWYEELFSPDDSEQKLELINSDPLWINDDPRRDPRWPVVSFVYEAKILWWTPIGADDINWLVFVSPEELDNIPIEDFAFPDHRESLLKHKQFYGL